MPTAALADAVIVIVVGEKHGEAFGDGAGRHEGAGHPAEVAQTESHLLFRLPPGADGRVIAIEKSGTGFDDEAVLAVEEGRQAELLHEKHGLAVGVIGQDRRAVAVIVHFADEPVRSSRRR